jgi:hypothetical protein
MGDGINREAARNSPKKTSRIINPFTIHHPCVSYFMFTRVSSIAIFNKPSRIAVEQKYSLEILISESKKLHKEIDEILKIRAENKYDNQSDSVQFLLGRQR